MRAPGGLQRLCSDCEGSGGCNDCEGAWAAPTLRSDCEGHLGSPLYPHRYPHPLSWIRSDEEQPADLGRQAPLSHCTQADPHSRCSLVRALQPKASLLPFTPDPRGWVRIAVRLEAGSDDDEGTTTGAGGVSRAVRLAVRIEAERDDDDAAMTGAGGVSRAVRIAVRIEGRRRRSDDEVDSFLWLPFVATVCGYRSMWLPMWLQPPGALTVSLPGALTVAAALQALTVSLQPEALTIAAGPQLSLIVAAAPQALTVAAAPQAPSQLAGAAAQAVAAASWASLLLFTPDPSGEDRGTTPRRVRSRCGGFTDRATWRRRQTGAGGAAATL